MSIIKLQKVFSAITVCTSEHTTDILFEHFF